MVDDGTEEEEDEASMPRRCKNDDLEDSDKDDTATNRREGNVKDYEVLGDKDLDLIAEA